MNKELRKYNIFLCVMLGIGLIGLIIGSFLDLSISNSIVNKNDMIGKTFETFGMIPGFMMINVGGVLLFKGLKKYDRLWTKILGWILLIASIVVSTYLSYSKGLTKTDRIDYGLRATKGIAFMFAIIGTIIGSGLPFLIKSDNKKLLITIGIAIIVLMIMQYATIEILKNLFHRPRYRFITDSSLNTEGLIFRNWFEFGKTKGSGDYYKSWPSGHTGTMSVTLMLPLISLFIKEKENKCFIITSLVSSVLVLSMLFYRVRVGAHFLSDVSTGLLIGTVFSFLISHFSMKICNKE